MCPKLDPADLERTDPERKPEREIDVTDVGPATVSIKLPEGGGLTVLCGDQGTGKSTTLSAVKRYLGDSSLKLPVRDGKKRGVVESGTARLSISSRTALTGEVDILSLEGRFEIDKLVDPKIATPDRADAARIKALLQLRQVQPNPGMFAKLLGSREELEKHVSPETLQATDLVEMAAKIKRELDAAARREEGQAEHASGHARGSEQQAAAVNLQAPHDAAELTRIYEQAVSERAAVRERVSASITAAENASNAREKLREAQESYQGSSSADYREQEAQLTVDHRWMVEEEARIAKELSAMSSRREQQQAKIEACRELFSAAASHEASLASWERTIAAGELPAPTPDEVTAADQAVLDAGEAIETGVKVRSALKAQEEARLQKQAAADHLEAAVKLREASKATDEVLSEQVQGDPLRVSAGRLILDTDRGEEFFAELSEGERWKLAIDLAIEAAGPWALIVIPQEAFQGLGPDSKNAIHEHARLRQVDVLGAQVTRGALRCETYEPDADEAAADGR